MPRFDEDDELLERYERYVISTPGVPEDYDTWVLNEYGENRKRSRKPRRSKYSDYGD